MMPLRMASWLALALSVAAGAAGCGGSKTGDALTSTDAAPLYSCMTETRAPYTTLTGVTRMSLGGTYAATIMSSTPDPPVKGSDGWTVQIADTTGAPIDGLTINVSPYMPDHQHGTTVRAVVTDNGAGIYAMTPLYLYMEGYWEVTLNLQPTTGAADSVMFPVCIP